MRIPIARKSSKGRSVPLTAESLVNMYAEEAPGVSKSEIVVHGSPGFVEFSDIAKATGGTALGKYIRGLYKTLNDGLVYAVIGDELVRVSSGGIVTQLGTIAGAGRVGMADNGVQLCVVAGSRGYTYDTTNGLQVISDRDFSGADTVTFIDGFFVFNNRKATQKGQFYISALLDGQTFDALDFATAERYPDNLTRVFADHSELLLFGTDSIEIWFNAGNADFPFARAQGSVIEQGLGARWSVEKIDESVVWLDNEGMVRRLQGLTPIRISDHAVEHKISKGDWTNATSWSYVQEGHQFYVLTVPAANISQTAGTYVFDAATSLWHERRSYDSDYLKMGFYVNAFGKHLVADETKVYDMSLDYYDEAGDALVSEMIFPQVQNDGRRFIVHKFQLDIETGGIPFVDTTVVESPAAWSSVLKGEGISLSNENLTASFSVGQKTVLSEGSVSSGKYYWEVTVDISSQSPRSTVRIGIGTPDTDLTNRVGDNVYTWGYYGFTGDYEHNEAVSQGQDFFGDGDVIMVALDMDFGLLWFGKNGVWQNSGDPASKANPSFPSPSPPLHATAILGSIIHAAASSDIVVEQVTANFGASEFVYNVPFGFARGFPA